MPRLNAPALVALALVAPPAAAQQIAVTFDGFGDTDPQGSHYQEPAPARRAFHARFAVRPPFFFGLATHWANDGGPADGYVVTRRAALFAGVTGRFGPVAWRRGAPLVAVRAGFGAAHEQLDDRIEASNGDFSCFFSCSHTETLRRRHSLVLPLRVEAEVRAGTFGGLGLFGEWNVGSRAPTRGSAGVQFTLGGTR